MSLLLYSICPARPSAFQHQLDAGWIEGPAALVEIARGCELRADLAERPTLSVSWRRPAQPFGHGNSVRQSFHELRILVSRRAFDTRLAALALPPLIANAVASVAQLGDQPRL